MECYNLRSGSLVNPVVSSSSCIQDSGWTEGNHLTDLAAGDAARLTAEKDAPNLMGSGETLSPPKRLTETFQTQEVCELVKPSGVRGEIMVTDLLIPTLTETLPEVSPGTVSTILGENLETGREQEQPPVLHPFHVTPPLSEAYATRDRLCLSPPHKGRLSFSGNFHPRHCSLSCRSTRSHHWMSVYGQTHRHTTSQLANSLLCYPAWFHTAHSPSAPKRTTTLHWLPKWSQSLHY